MCFNCGFYRAHDIAEVDCVVGRLLVSIFERYVRFGKLDEF